MKNLTPREIVAELDKHIIGQNKAKRSVAIAMRNRWRRMQLDESIREETTPKNILMIGSTGVGKTEIARRLAKLTDAPFLKVEATKFTEVGYVGKEVDSIINELAEVAMKMLREEQQKKYQKEGTEQAEKKVVEALFSKFSEESNSEKDDESFSTIPTREEILDNLRKGLYDKEEIFIDLPKTNDLASNIQIMLAPDVDSLPGKLRDIYNQFNSEISRTHIKVTDALKIITEDEESKLVNENDIKHSMVNLVENQGIVFIDEIDKICENQKDTQTRVSREGVQRDLLPLIEGCAVRTKYGVIRTDHILFITSGAFQLSKPSDLIPELQGRLPIRVELESLTAKDFARILTEPHASLTEQYIKLMETEGVNISFSQDGIDAIAEAAYSVNSSVEDIGARRLHTIMEKLMEDISFNASEYRGSSFSIDRSYVSEHLGNIIENEDLSRYIL
ncbi:ATP-dependent HslUV protease ATP-binding subunit HslU [Ruminobacter amylophilus]|uniref:ATP-dependent HslUV protease ATP-binding subunit HslU n=1 Tax=Ruminobacter amylophilus TaxID=867 RepID=A0A662ZJC4_9GAMM|nr:ATP-dependent protease ATPase subunit HslU [Ruminobacter amylophilus]SFP46744.1 ATP-dependent HslUV protease ATP-binding subunit HslU [Ruminobacter amylophilus]